jgi:NADH-quinone oxidoreductase subunit M
MDHILSIVLLTPLAGLLVLLFIPSSNARAVKLWANAISLVGFLVSLPLAFQFDPGKDFQFVEKAPCWALLTISVSTASVCCW